MLEDAERLVRKVACVLLLAAGCGPGKTGARAPDAPAAARPVASSGAPEDTGRFVSFNVPNLHYVEDDWRFEAPDRFRLPDEFEIRDALESVRQLGGSVVRIYALSVRKQSDPQSRVRHVLGPGSFDETAFVALDRVLSVAGELGIRVIVPFVDNWRWWGGVADYAAFRGRPAQAFWSDAELIADFERTIAHVVSRRNTLTGRTYRDDPTILAWETGNELEAPYAWTARVAAFIRSLDPVHPVIDGFHSDTVRDEAIADPNIGMLTTHHYTSAARTVAAIRENVARIAGKKPYFVGEFGLVPRAEIERVLDAVVADPGVLGALLWSLRFHRREGGFYWHWERDDYYSYHWPGFDSGEPFEERAVLGAVQRAAAAVRGVPAPSRPRPRAPLLLPIANPSAISWQGAAGAESYTLERAPAPAGPWQPVARGVSDATLPYRPLAADTRAPPGQTHYYRVFAVNGAGSSEASNVVGPVGAETSTLIDELADTALIHALTGTVELSTGEPHRFKLDATRVRGSDGAAVVYAPPGPIRAVRVFAHQWDPDARLLLETSVDGARFVPLATSATVHARQDLIDHFDAVLYTAQDLAAKQLRIRLAARTELGRVEIDYQNPSMGVPAGSP